VIGPLTLNGFLSGVPVISSDCSGGGGLRSLLESGFRGVFVFVE